MVFYIVFRLGEKTHIALIGHLEQNQLKWKMGICLTSSTKMTILKKYHQRTVRYDPNNQLVLFNDLFRSRMETKIKIIG
jgi:hypothetical protein